MALPEPSTPIQYPQSLEDLEAQRLQHRKMLRPQHVAMHAIVPGISHMSPSRSVMSIQQMSQHLVWSKMEKPVVLTGVEYEFAKYAFKDVMPENGEIVAVIPRYPSIDRELNPETTVMYIREQDGALDYFNIRRWDKYHPNFGYMKKVNFDNISQLTEGRLIGKDVPFATSPGVADDGCYMSGINANVAYVDDERAAEDGMIFREGFINDKLTVDIFEEIEVSLGTKDFAINLWGDNQNYKIFPDIGEQVGHDGLLMVKRKYDDINSPVLMSPINLREPDAIADEFVYTKPTSVKKGQDPLLVRAGEIVDIRVLRNPRSKHLLPPTMGDQLERYAFQYQVYLSNILKVEQKLLDDQRRKNGPEARLNMTPKMQILLKRARGLTGYGSTRASNQVEFQTNRGRMDEWTIYFTVRHRRTATKGDKFAGLFGDKGVVVKVYPDSDFPKGVDIIVASSSTIGRTNLNRLFVPRFATAAVDLTQELKQMLQIPENVEPTLEMLNHPSYPQVLDRLLKFYAIVSPHLYYTYSKANEDQLRNHVLECLKEVVHPLMPIDNPINDIDAIIHLEKEGYLKPYTPITYRNASGKIETTDKPIPVLSTYIIYLEKIANEGSGISFPKLQHHGLPASRSNQDRYTYNYRNVPTRNIGVHESEILNHDARSPALIAELMDRSNNPEVMMEQARQLLLSDKPMALERLVDRKQFPLGEMRPKQIISHFFETQGFRLKYQPDLTHKP